MRGTPYRGIGFVAVAAALCSALTAATPTSRPSTTTTTAASLSDVDAVRVVALRYRGNTAFTAAQLNDAARPVLDRQPDRLCRIEDLQAIASTLTLLYVNAGYINSGVTLPDQTLEGGVVTFDVTEGKLAEIRVSRRPTPGPNPAAGQMAPGPQPQNAGMRPVSEAQSTGGTLHPNQVGPAPLLPDRSRPGLHLLRDRYITDRVYLSAGPPLNVNALKERLEILRQDPNIDAINATLLPDDAPGSSILDIVLTERQPLHLGASFNNSRSPSVGAYRAELLASDSDLTGHGDSLSLRWGVLYGEIDAMRYSSLNDLSVDYGIPITRYDTTFLFDYTRSSDLIVQAPFARANISSQTDEYSGTFRQPILRTPTSELAVSFGISSKSNVTTAMGQPFGFGSAGQNGQTDVFVLRFGQEFSRQSAVDGLTAHSTFSIGLPIANASSRTEPDRRFFAWLGQMQYIRAVPLGPPSTALAGAAAIARINAQLTGDSLSALEQFSLGGMHTVRGYEENQLVRDNGANSQFEVRLPVIHRNGRDYATLVPFFDAGYGWNASSPSSSELLTSIGIGAILTPNDNITAQIYFGYAFKDFHNPGNDVQKMGIHFSLTASAF